MKSEIDETKRAIQFNSVMIEKCTAKGKAREAERFARVKMMNEQRLSELEDQNKNALMERARNEAIFRAKIEYFLGRDLKSQIASVFQDPDKIGHGNTFKGFIQVSQHSAERIDSGFHSFDDVYQSLIGDFFFRMAYSWEPPIKPQHGCVIFGVRHNGMLEIFSTNYDSSDSPTSPYRHQTSG